jgi:hypothetical protein
VSGSPSALLQPGQCPDPPRPDSSARLRWNC